MNNEELCLRLIKAESESDVIYILKDAGYWDDSNAWVVYGGRETNYSIIGNQQSNAEAALVEKLTNSIDAMLMLECKKRGIDPTDSSKAPKSIHEAAQLFFGINDGSLTRVTKSDRGRLADNIMLVATGRKARPCYTIIDRGEGQSPCDFPSTLLSLNESNKNRIPFVQGRFNMGSTGVLHFCGEDGETHLQLIVSRRHPELSMLEKKSNPDVDQWGFTITRRCLPEGNMKNSVYKYLAPMGKILSFSADSLHIIPGEYPIPYERPLDWGTIVKMYEYRVPRQYKGPVNLDLNYRLALLLAEPALPVRIYERRKGYDAHTLSGILSGLTVRLEEDPRNNLEDDFNPASSSITVQGQIMPVKIYVFRKRKTKRRYAPDQGVVFTYGGQTHGSLSKSLYRREKVKLTYLRDSLLIVIDCSSFDAKSVERLFMNSRDRLYDGALKDEIVAQLEKLAREHEGLRELHHRRQNEARKKMISDSKPLETLVTKFIKKSRAIANLLLPGSKIHHPYDLRRTQIQEAYHGVFYPDYFELVRNESRECPSNRDFRMKFETNANNDYFVREHHPGSFTLLLDGNPVSDYRINLFRGMANLTVILPTSVNLGDTLHYRTEVTDASRSEPFQSSFEITVTTPVVKSSGKRGPRLPPPGDKGEEKREDPSRLALPNVIPVYRDDWSEHGFDSISTLKVVRGDDGKYDFYINFDNDYFLTEVKTRTEGEGPLLKEQFKVALVLLGLSFLNTSGSNNFEHENESESVYEHIEKYSSAIAPMIIPIVNDLSSLLNNES